MIDLIIEEKEVIEQEKNPPSTPSAFIENNLP